MSYKVDFPAFGNFPMFADSFSVVSIQYVARELRGCNRTTKLIAGSFLYKWWNMNMKYLLL